VEIAHFPIFVATSKLAIVRARSLHHSSVVVALGYLGCAERLQNMLQSSNLNAPLVDGRARNASTESREAHLVVPENEFYYKFWFSSQTYYMMRPVENVHIYLWILKDLAWSQDWYYPALIFGSLALLWCAVLFYEAFIWESLYEAYMAVAVTLWLAANFVWMAGNLNGHS
jgi:hypothetical protein